MTAPRVVPSAEGASGWLVCFAVKEEGAGLDPDMRRRVMMMITGMGPACAGRGIEAALARKRPSAVITAGFAGGLAPALPRGTVVYECDDGLQLDPVLQQLGAVRATFHSCDRVVVTPDDKRTLRAATGADVVEMESGVIRRCCREGGVPSATIRVISDAADESLPLDFNRLMTAEGGIHWRKLALELLLRPPLIPRLIRFQKHTRAAAEELGRVLNGVLRVRTDPHAP